MLYVFLATEVISAGEEYIKSSYRFYYFFTYWEDWCTSFLNKSNKKGIWVAVQKEMNNQSNKGKKVQMSWLDSPTSSGKVFAESLKLDDCVKIFMNCLINLEKEVLELKDLAWFINATQIKDERQLLNFKDQWILFLISLMNWNVITGKRKNYKRLKRRNELSEGKSGPYNSGITC